MNSKNTFLLIFFTFISVSLFSQQYKELRVTNNNKEIINAKNIFINVKSGTFKYTDENNRKKMLMLSQIAKVEQKKGSYWASGLLGGLAGSILVNVIATKTDEPWYLGAGPSIVAGTGAATLTGALIPKYKEINLNDHSKIDVGINYLRISF